MEPKREQTEAVNTDVAQDKHSVMKTKSFIVVQLTSNQITAEYVYFTPNIFENTILRSIFKSNLSNLT